MKLLLLLFLACGSAFAANLDSQAAGYSLAFGPDNYISHLLYGEAAFYNKKKDVSLSPGLSLFRDVDYDIIASLSFRGKKRLVPGTRIGGILIISSGNLAKDDSSSSSTSIGVSVDRDMTQSANVQLEYRFTNGSIYSGVYRETIISSGSPKKKNNTGQAVAAYEYVPSDFSSNTLITTLDLCLDAVIRSLSSTLKLTLSQNSYNVKAASYDIELYYPIYRKVYISSGLTVVSTSLEQTNSYFSLGISRIF